MMGAACHAARLALAASMGHLVNGARGACRCICGTSPFEVHTVARTQNSSCFVRGDQWEMKMRDFKFMIAYLDAC